jgi:hypothetical protein
VLGEGLCLAEQVELDLHRRSPSQTSALAI